MKLLLLLLVVALVVLAVWLVLTARARQRSVAPAGWRVVTRTLDDGTYVVAVRGEEGGERVVRSLPPALEGAELTSELRLAREEAQLQADELNRS
jgi:hypothetical protein